MKRKINEPLLIVRALLYRIVAVLCQTGFLFIFYGLVIGKWEIQLAIGSSIVINVFNTIVYYGFHHWFDSRFKIGRN